MNTNPEDQDNAVPPDQAQENEPENGIDSPQPATQADGEETAIENAETPFDSAAPPPADDEKDQRIATLEAQLEQAKDQMLRAIAEAENTRRRAAKEREDTGKYAISSFAKDLLDFADNFKRALESVPDDLAEADERISGVLQGIATMEKELLRTFEKHGIEKIEPEGEIFNPHFHEVMFETAGTGQPGGTIIQVIEPGYILKGRLLRPARVGVAKADDSESSGQQGPGSQIDQEI